MSHHRRRRRQFISEQQHMNISVYFQKQHLKRLFCFLIKIDNCAKSTACFFLHYHISMWLDQGIQRLFVPDFFMHLHKLASFLLLRVSFCSIYAKRSNLHIWPENAERHLMLCCLRLYEVMRWSFVLQKANCKSNNPV